MARHFHRPAMDDLLHLRRHKIHLSHTNPAHTNHSRNANPCTHSTKSPYPSTSCDQSQERPRQSRLYEAPLHHTQLLHWSQGTHLQALLAAHYLCHVAKLKTTEENLELRWQKTHWDLFVSRLSFGLVRSWPKNVEPFCKLLSIGCTK